MSLYEPARGGTRGGKDQFVWEDVKSDKYRENYLAHSLMAPVGRWQKGKDLIWYTKESKVTGKKEALRNEVAAVKQAEEEAMARALGLKVPVKKVPAPASLSQREMAEVCKRRTSESAEMTGREVIEGVGFKSQKGKMVVKGTSQEGVTSFESDSVKDQDRLILRRTSERERISSISSEQDQSHPRVSTSDLVPTEEESITRKDKKKHQKKEKRKKKEKKSRSAKKSTTKRHKQKTDTPNSDDPAHSSDEEDDARRRHSKKRRHRHRHGNDNSSDEDERLTSRRHKHVRHDTDSD